MKGIRKSVKDARYSVREISEKAERMDEVTRFDIGQPSFDTPEAAKKAAKKAISRERITYTSLWGIPELRKEVADFESKKSSYSAENVMVTTGGIGALFSVFSTLCNPGENIVFSDPCWSVYPLIVSGSSAEMRQTPFIKNGKVNHSGIRDRIGPDTKAIVINSPENPSGRVYTKKQIKEIVDIARENDIWVIGDEVYDRLTYGKEHVSVAEIAPERSLVINSMSKNFAMTGWRIGWVISRSKELINEMGKLNRSTTACPNFPAQHAALEALRSSKDYVEEMRKEYQERKEILEKELDNMGLEYTEPEGAIYIFPDIGMDSWRFSTKLLKEAKVAVVPGEPSGKDSRNNIRICFGSVGRDEIKEGMKRIESFMD
ncbi:MAG: aminotransferase class I/II-fold pyridoxal phosphate-dependent enzyme [Candidatus Nanohaloarchaea archaeon]|nr:aminotransferase class I/II-fold pyridoxal phosphate-dependent enzyme [Candidatus Nanohaloarchaea archaeon]